jgi:hypothetical protein
MMTTHDFQKAREPEARPISVSVALLFVVAGLNIAATVLSFLVALQG